MSQRRVLRLKRVDGKDARDVYSHGRVGHVAIPLGPIQADRREKSGSAVEFGVSRLKDLGDTEPVWRGNHFWSEIKPCVSSLPSVLNSQ